mmetsp:Transcript_12396/g.20337  ORF Transcript_12396/g.20337 Transcript_12396/m.20337 type:complete len:110 (+) Transcript_12396:80-409(+)
MPVDLNEDVWRTLHRRVALFDFEPSSLTNWPFTRQKPLAFKTGQVVEVVYDDGSDWLLGHLPCLPEMVGYFPKDYVVSVEEYEELLKEWKDAETMEEPTSLPSTGQRCG